MSSERVNFIADVYEASFKTTKGALGKVPEDRQMKQVHESKAHPLWLVGHLAMTNDLLIGNWILGKDLTIPGKWGVIFAPKVAGGKDISSNADDYPGWDELVTSYVDTGVALVESIRELQDDQLPGDVLGPIPDQFRDGFGKLGEALFGLAMHDAHHRGQIALLAALD